MNPIIYLFFIGFFSVRSDDSVLGAEKLILFRPGTGWVFAVRQGLFGSSFVSEFASMNGLNYADLSDPADRGFAFDYDHSGKKDHVVIYRPGTGIFWIEKDSGEIFLGMFRQYPLGNGIGGYDLKSIDDRAFAFDYDHTGKQDHIVLYRPGTGKITILKHVPHSSDLPDPFAPVYQQDNGIAGYDLKSPYDRVFEFDYDHTGKLDHMVLYRPGTGAISILKNKNGTFSPVYKKGVGGSGIGGFDLKNTLDRAFAFDYDHSGKQDHMVWYRPGTGLIFILKNKNGVFSTVYKQSTGVGGYDLMATADYAFAYDYEGTGKKDHIVLARPGGGRIWILKNVNGLFSRVYGDFYYNGSYSNIVYEDVGIGGFNFTSINDKIIPIEQGYYSMRDSVSRIVAQYITP